MENKRKFSKRYCIAYGCLNSNKSFPDLSLFSLPKETERRREWLTLIGREDLLSKEDLKNKSYEVCSAHFDDSVIKIIKQLKTNALPTKLLPKQTQEGTSSSTSEKPTDVFSKNLQSDIRLIEPTSISTGTQTMTPTPSEKIIMTYESLNDKTPQKRKLSKDLQISEYKRRRLDYVLQKNKKLLEAKNAFIKSDPEDDINRIFQKLTDWQNKLKNKSKGNRYDAEYKMFALNLHYSSPQAYRCLQTVLKLPSKSIINRFKINIPPKLDDLVLESLSMKMKSLPQKAKYCTICVDQKVLKRNLYYDIKKDEVVGFHNINGEISPDIASNAYVIMLQGIYFNWKQPIAYCFLASTKHYIEIDTWMNEVIRKLFGVGIEIKAIISNQGSNFDKYAKEIKEVTINSPYFFVDEHKIYYIFDVPHLLKCVRNNLLSSNFHHEGNVISWDHVKKMYDDQKQRNLKLIPKITDAHVEPNSFQKMRVKYAAQIFSNTVYAALETYIDFGQMSEEARATSEFIKTMDGIFDVLNSSKVKVVKQLQTAFRMSKKQKKILTDGQNMFANIKSVNRKTGKENTKQMKTFVNFQITIQSIIQLFEDLNNEGFQYLMTRRLNQDSLENFFGCIRQQGGSCTYPTPIQFMRLFSKLFLVNMLKTSPTANCKSDIYEILLKVDDLMNTTRIITEEVPTSLVALDGEKSHRLDLPDQNALTYVAGYLIFKCSNKHDCDEMVRALKSVPELDQTKLFAQYKAYNKKASFYGSIKIPPQEFNQYIDELEKCFTKNFENCIQNRPGSTIFEFMKEIPPVKLCSCFPIDYLLKLYVRLRIFATLKFNNRCFKDGKKSIKQYLKVKQLQ